MATPICMRYELDMSLWMNFSSKQFILNIILIISSNPIRSNFLAIIYICIQIIHIGIQFKSLSLCSRDVNELIKNQLVNSNLTIHSNKNHDLIHVCDERSLHLSEVFHDVNWSDSPNSIYLMPHIISPC